MDRPADVLLPFWANGKDAALDVSMVNPLQHQFVEKVAREGEKRVQHAYITSKWGNTLIDARQRELCSFLWLLTLSGAGTRTPWKLSQSEVG